MSLATFGAGQIYDKELAKDVADRFARRLEQGHHQRAAEMLFGASPGRTLGDVLKRMHDARGGGWSESHTRDQRRFKKFWLDKLGEDMPLLALNAALVESIAEEEAREREWAPRTHASYLRYIVDALYFAQNKLKWIEDRHNLSAVEMPRATSKGEPYTLDEIRRLLPALEDVDPRAGWLGHVLWQTGRRLSAARTLPTSAVTVHEGWTEVRWPEETDKAGRGGVSVIVGKAHALTRKLLAESGPFVLGAEPPSLETCIKEWLPAAEKAAGIEHVDGRAWHGIKRRFSDRTEGMKGRGTQAGTREDTLRTVYDPEDDLAAMRRVAERMHSELNRDNSRDGGAAKRSGPKAENP